MHDKSTKYIRLLVIGDVVGAPGRAMFQKYVSSLRNTYAIDGVVVNGENSSSNGRGITPRIAHFFRHNGADIITTGNHIWHFKDIYEYLNQHSDVLRPENYPTECPGSGIGFFDCKGFTVGVLNLQGRIFMRDNLACPFKTAESALTFLRSKTNIILVDFHAEATAEKMGMAYFLDGKVSAVVGTHTHIQTADERILPKGTAYITDLGMVGALNSMIGMQKEPIIRNMITQMPVKFVVDNEPPLVLSGVVISIDTACGKASSIERIRIIDETLQTDES